MKNKIIRTGIAALLQSALSANAGAASPLPAKDTCFIVDSPDEIIDMIKIRPQKPLSRDISKPVPVVGLEGIVFAPDDSSPPPPI